MRDLEPRLLLALSLVGCLTACQTRSFDTVGHPTAVTLTGPSAGVVDQPLTFRYEAQGMALAGVEVAWGDGRVDSVFAFGAQTAAGNLVHAWTTDGTFSAIATVVESSGFSVSDTLLVAISQ